MVTHIHTAINPSDVYPVPGCDECRLIAAAPDLLLALRYVYEYYAPMTIFDDETGDTGHDEAMEIVRAAIAKAKGV